ncbi:hypothetical protein [Thiomicrospira sp. WB1]|uniref:AAA family ATPase n=1 Tax=Thiomicrospira sp. WB1 TaxID=1685380 RepID=UPI00074791C0|nr:hypothetical protein [Thiomicrospira sp. WB1]KUJ71543.1 hypothetical protein AVO41_08485 [Thiomicrospira sp. WB1]
MEDLNKIRLPKLTYVELDGFSIYKKVDGKISLDISKDVYCLTGANGLGKSTFLTSIIYGFCGFLRGQSTDLTAPDKREKEGRKIARNYFSGRSDFNGESSISLKFTIEVYQYSIKRKISEAGEILSLNIIDISNGNKDLYQDNATDSTDVKTDIFEKYIALHTNLKSFHRFAFLIQDVMSFDENHHLLFWDSHALEYALFSCIGLDPSIADKTNADKFESERIASHIRNTQWAISQAKKAISESLKDIDIGILDMEKAQELQEEIDSIQDEIELLERQKRDEESLLAQEVQNKFDKEIKFRNLFKNFSSRTLQTKFYKKVEQSIIDQSCFSCGSTSEESIKNIRKLTDSECCPVCNTYIEKNELNEGLTSELTKADLEIQEAQAEIVKIEEKCSNLNNRITAQITSKEQLQSELHQLVPEGFSIEEHENTIKKNSHIDALEKTKRKYIEEKAKIDKSYAEGFKLLADQYLTIENKFVPLFKKLAQKFIGVEVEINMDMSPNKKPNHKKPPLSLFIGGSARAAKHELSESQRFFIDIALKMSLIQFATKEDENVTMLLDTPEGSLDIAYEAMVGEMFSQFALKNSLFLTANLNSSKILTQLAKNCGHQKMHVERMTGWADLSQVQQDSEGLFNDAYDEIAKHLGA